jgi:hypothetical protein
MKNGARTGVAAGLAIIAAFAAAGGVLAAEIKALISGPAAAAAYKAKGLDPS